MTDTTSLNGILHVVYHNPITKRRSKTGIGYATSLSHRMTVRYLGGLIGQGLLRISYDPGLYGHYEITPKGIRYLQIFAEMEDDLWPLVKS